jgi:hypothetical protein
MEEYEKISYSFETSINNGIDTLARDAVDKQRLRIIQQNTTLVIQQAKLNEIHTKIKKLELEKRLYEIKMQNARDRLGCFKEMARLLVSERVN